MKHGAQNSTPEHEPARRAPATLVHASCAFPRAWPSAPPSGSPHPLPRARPPAHPSLRRVQTDSTTQDAYHPQPQHLRFPLRLRHSASPLQPPAHPADCHAPSFPIPTPSSAMLTHHRFFAPPLPGMTAPPCRQAHRRPSHCRIHACYPRLRHQRRCACRRQKKRGCGARALPLPSPCAASPVFSLHVPQSHVPTW